MVTLEFEQLSFEQKLGFVRVYYLNNYYFDIPDKKQFSITKNSITFDDISKEKAERVFSKVLDAGFQHLTNRITGKHTVYVHRNSGIPLIGTNYFGIVDRNTNYIEVKPLTGCNIDCIFCSVDQDKRQNDFLVELDYLVDETRKLADFKDCKVECVINPQGEPLLYPQIVELVKKLAEFSSVSINTNGIMLSEKLVNQLKEAGLSRLNISINSLNRKKAAELAAKHYPIEKIKELCDYIIKKELLLVIAPVWVPGINDLDIAEIIKFGKKKNIPVRIQNFFSYKFGKRPAKEIPMNEFYNHLEAFEKKYKVKLIGQIEEALPCEKSKQLPKPFKKGGTIKADIVCEGAFTHEMIAAASARAISVADCSKKGLMRLKILRSKHNIFFAKVT